MIPISDPPLSLRQSDISLVFDDTRIQCDRDILACNCDYFNALFRSDWNDKNAEEFVIKGINAATGLLIVKYLYTDAIEITKDNARSLLEASEILLLGELKQRVQKR
eukprot:GHVO01007277.1.p1 GENE.GHVO01007277.1~~GHVO01007277.1.p1  ORF type:complete len:107 (+),score=10.21 GHVO01007277.1:189-509(+)